MDSLYEQQNKFPSPEAPGVFLFLKDGDIVISQSSQKGGTANASRTAADESDLRVVALWHLLW